MAQTTKTHQGTSSLSLIDFFEHTYFAWVETNHSHSDATKRTLLSDCEQFLGDKLEEITPTKIEAWRQRRLKQEQTSTATLNRIFATLRASLNHAVDIGLIASNPIEKVKLLPETSIERVRYLQADEEKRLRQTLSNRDEKLKSQRARTNEWRAARRKDALPSLKGARFGDHIAPMTLLSMNTGIKRNELFKLRWSQIDLTENILRLNRDIPLNEETRQLLVDWKSQQNLSSDYVFPNRNGQPHSDIKKAWKAILIEADLIDFQWNDLRHHFAVKLAKANIGLKTLQEILGLSSFRMVEKYAGFSPDNARLALESIR